jgi:hypothetical protein
MSCEIKALGVRFAQLIFHIGMRGKLGDGRMRMNQSDDRTGEIGPIKGTDTTV